MCVWGGMYVPIFLVYFVSCFGIVFLIHLGDVDMLNMQSTHILAS